MEDEPATNEIGASDIGIESVSVAKNGTKVDIIAKITNTNAGPVSANVKIRAKNMATNAMFDCTPVSQDVQLNAGSSKEARCTFSGLATALYQAEVAITPSINCDVSAKCADKAATNRLTRNFYAGDSGLQQCLPYSTARLDKFLLASGINAPEMVKKVKFRATLMQDGYSADFQRDFDLAQRQAFFNAPAWYLSQTGCQNAGECIGTYFKDTKLFTFDSYSQPDYSLPGPGTYDVVIDINYADSTWSLFDAQGNPKANIKVTMQKLKGAEPDSPFYYLPIDGLVGDNGRTGYGINFNGDSIVLDNNPAAVRTVEIAGSSPIPDGTLSVEIGKSFKRMQVDEPGIVARLSRTEGNPKLLFQPSYATPVVMQIDKKSGSDAYATYQVAVDGDATDVGPTLAKWNGVGILCRAFNDEALAQQQNVPDTHAISASCSLVKAGDRSIYTLEFCGEPKNFGTVSYEAIFYTPQGSNSYVRLTGAASDKARLLGAVAKTTIQV